MESNVFSLNLSKGFDPFKRNALEINFETFIFKGGEMHIKLKAETNWMRNANHIYITHRIYNGDDVMLLMMAVNAVRNNGYDKKISLVLPYIPYARQDRICDVGEAFSLKVFANLLNSLEFSNVLVLDPHSEVSPTLINNCRALDMSLYVYNAITKIASSNLCIVSPDAGSNKKISGLCKSYHLKEFFKDSSEIIKCDKVRDVTNGKLTGFTVYSEDIKGKDCLIVDDICDGGGTFLGVAEALKAKGAGKLHLYITHGIFSNGLEELQKAFCTIHTTDSFCKLSSTVLPFFYVQNIQLP